MPLESARRQGRRYINPVPTPLGGLSILFKVGPKFFLGARARSPQVPLGPFRTDISRYEVAPRTGLRVTWLGHASSLVEMDGVRILIDPVWDERAAPTNWAGPRRFFSPPLRLSDLPPLDAVIISHDHYDHLGAGTIRELSRLPALGRARWLMPLGVSVLLSRLGVRPSSCFEMNWLDGTEIGAVRVTALPTRHFSGRGLFNRCQTLWASFALSGPEHNLYYGADSGEWEGLREIGVRYGPFDLAMLEIGASDPLWAEIHMGPLGAVRSFQALGGGGLLMPIHWGLFDLAFHHWRQPIESIWGIDGLKLWSPTPGEPCDVVRGEELRSEWWR